MRSSVETSTAPRIIAIKPPSGWLTLDLAELWEYRELLVFLIWRDLKVRYRQTAIGVAWVVLQPLLTTIVFTLIFGRLARLPSENVPYAVFVLAGLLPWQLFSGAISRAGVSLVASANLLTKVYFPRLMIPAAAVLSGVVDLVLSLLILAGLMAWYGVTPGLSLLTLPLFAVLAVLAALAVALWLSALNVQYRDVQYALPFLIQIWMFASPVVYSGTLVPTGAWRVVYNLNPITGVIQGFRWALTGKATFDPLMWVSVLAMALLLVTGLFYFRGREDTFADVV